MRLLLIIFFTTVVYACEAQTSGVILDIETREPVANVQIYTNTNKVVTTDKSGKYSIFIPFSSVTISRAGYVKRTLDHDELKDTVYILPKSISLNEVVVTATAPKFGFDIKKAALEAAAIGAASAPQGCSFNFFKMFERHRVSAKERERRHKAVANY